MEKAFDKFQYLFVIKTSRRKLGIEKKVLTQKSPKIYHKNINNIFISYYGLKKVYKSQMIQNIDTDNICVCVCVLSSITYVGPYIHQSREDSK